jgi:hypothetical protein
MTFGCKASSGYRFAPVPVASLFHRLGTLGSKKSCFEGHRLKKRYSIVFSALTQLIKLVGLKP